MEQGDQPQDPSPPQPGTEKEAKKEGELHRPPQGQGQHGYQKDASGCSSVE